MQAPLVTQRSLVQGIRSNPGPREPFWSLVHHRAPPSAGTSGAPTHHVVVDAGAVRDQTSVGEDAQGTSCVRTGDPFSVRTFGHRVRPSNGSRARGHPTYLPTSGGPGWRTALVAVGSRRIRARIPLAADVSTAHRPAARSPLSDNLAARLR